MKILFHHRIASRDGQAVHMEELIAAFRRLGHEVIVVGPRTIEQQEFGGESGWIRGLKDNLPRAVFELLELSYSLVAFLRLYAEYRRHRPDALYERYNLFLLAGAWLHRWSGLPYLLEVNAPLYEERAQFGGIALKGVAIICQKTVWRAADMVLPVTQVLGEYVRRAGVPTERITVIPNGIDSERFLGRRDSHTAKTRLGLDNELVLGFTGFVRQWHGLTSTVDFIAGANAVAKPRLLIVGEGPGLDALAERAEELGVRDRVKFAGLVDRESIPDVVAAFDVALQPAATSYASPLKIFEYMALGRAILAPRQPNIEEILTDGETALLFDPADPNSFRDQLARLCADPALRDRLGAAARALIAGKDFTWDGNAKRVSYLFQQAATARMALQAS